MKKTKKPLAPTSLVCIAIVTALLATWLSGIVEEGGLAEPGHFESTAADGQRQIDWDSLPDSVVAWVEVPGTSIDDPIVQAIPDAPNAYLYLDALGQGAYGTPYIDSECSIDSRFVMVYGHHMSDGSVFADFASFIDPGYASEHSEIIVYKRGGEVLYLHPVAADVVNASTETLVIDQGGNLEEYASAADLVLEEASAEERLFAFATCSYQTRNSRTIVYAQQ